MEPANPELKELAQTCADLKAALQSDREQRAKNDKRDRLWQLLTILLPIAATSLVGVMLNNGQALLQARLQESVAASENYDTNQLKQFEDLDQRVLALLGAVQRISDADSGTTRLAAVSALTALNDPLSDLYFDSDFDAPVRNIKDLVSNSNYLHGQSDPDDNDMSALGSNIRMLEQLMLKKLKTK